MFTLDEEILRNAEEVSVSNVFDEVDQELFGETLEANEPAERRVPKQLRGNLNDFYEKYAKNPTDENQENLFRSTENFVVRVTGKVSGKMAKTLNFSAKENHQSTDISQDVLLKVWKNLNKFDGRSKFSSWVYKIVSNEVFDTINRLSNRNEFELNDEVVNGASNAGFRGGSPGAGPDDGAKGHGRVPIIGGTYIAAHEVELNNGLDIGNATSKLSARDRTIVGLFMQGYGPSEIGRKLGYNAKWGQNNFDRLKELLGDLMCVRKILLHTCRRSITPSSTFDDRVFYTEESGAYFPLSSKCRCNKWLTRKEADAFFEEGAAGSVYKIKNGQPVLIEKEVWSAQAVRVPRCGMVATTKAGIERAYVDGNAQVRMEIELSHQMDIEARRKLIVPFRPDPWDGRPRFTAFTDERTKGGHESESPRNAYFTRTSRVPNAHLTPASLSEDYFRGPGSKSLISEVLVAEREGLPGARWLGVLADLAGQAIKHQAQSVQL